MDLEEYMKEKHRKKNNINSIDDKKIKYLKNLLTRVLLSIILVISISISIKINNNNISLINKYVFEANFKFTKINNWYQDNFGKIIPTVDNSDEMLVFSSEELKLMPYEKYNDGIKMTTDKYTSISTLMGGIVVFIGEKDFYENTVIIQGNDGIDYWYGGISNVTLNLYDYIDTNTLIGETANDYLYIVLQKDGKFIDYEEIL